MSALELTIHCPLRLNFLTYYAKHMSNASCAYVFFYDHAMEGLSLNITDHNLLHVMASFWYSCMPCSCIDSLWHSSNLNSPFNDLVLFEYFYMTLHLVVNSCFLCGNQPRSRLKIGTFEFKQEKYLNKNGTDITFASSVVSTKNFLTNFFSKKRTWAHLRI